MAKNAVKLRAALNRVLQVCKTESEWRQACLKWQLDNEARDLWFLETHISFGETYHSLAVVHLSRIKEEEEWAVNLSNWNQDLEECGSLEGFETLRGKLQNSHLCDDADKWDALREKGILLGHPDYMED